MAVKYTKGPKNIPTSSIVRHYKIYPNWYFWFENKPSGNPAFGYSHGLHIYIDSLMSYIRNVSLRNESLSNECISSLEHSFYTRCRRNSSINREGVAAAH
jgi:hypothetical protein